MRKRKRPHYPPMSLKRIQKPPKKYHPPPQLRRSEYQKLPPPLPSPPNHPEGTLSVNQGTTPTPPQRRRRHDSPTGSGTCGPEGKTGFEQHSSLTTPRRARRGRSGRHGRFPEESGDDCRSNRAKS